MKHINNGVIEVAKQVEDESTKCQSEKVEMKSQIELLEDTRDFLIEVNDDGS